MKTVLISGASVAGPTLAYWLDHSGMFKVTVVERSRELRLGGQNLDVKGPAEIITKMMDLQEKVKNCHTTEIGAKVVNKNGNTVATFHRDHSMAVTTEHEILRGDLVDLLVSSTEKAYNVEFMFGDHIIGLVNDENADKVDVTFKSGKKESYDYVIAADGIRSYTRSLIFNKFEVDEKFLGMYQSFFTVPKIEGDDEWAKVHFIPGSKCVAFRPDGKGTMRALFMFKGKKEQRYHQLNREGKIEVLREQLEGVTWGKERFLKEMEDDETRIYLDYVGQVRMKKYTKNRCAVVGDSGWAPSPLLGGGTEMAIYGSYILAGEMAMQEARGIGGFGNYDQIMQPFTHHMLKIPLGVPNMMFPQTKMGVKGLNVGFKVLGSKLVDVIAKKKKRIDENGEVLEKDLLAEYKIKEVPRYDKMIKDMKRLSL